MENMEYEILFQTEKFQNAKRWQRRHKAQSRFNDIIWVGGPNGWAVVVYYHPNN